MKKKKTKSTKEEKLIEEQTLVSTIFNEMKDLGDNEELRKIEIIS